MNETGIGGICTSTCPRPHTDVDTKAFSRGAATRLNLWFARATSHADVKHKAGNRGTFPVYVATPVIKVGGGWYNARTMELVEYGNLTVPIRVRYLMLALSF